MFTPSSNMDPPADRVCPPANDLKWRSLGQSGQTRGSGAVAPVVSGLDQVVPDGEAHEFGGGAHPGLAHGGGAVALHRLDADLEFAGDALVALALGDQLGDLELAHPAAFQP